MLECDGRRGCVGEISFCALALKVLKVHCHFVQLGSSRVFLYGTEVLVLLPRCTFTASVYSIGSLVLKYLQLNVNLGVICFSLEYLRLGAMVHKY